MKNTVIIFGSTTGTCESLAGQIAAKLGVNKIVNAASLDASVVEAAENLILGTSTWGCGDLQDDWYEALDIIKSANLAGKTVAIFGCGDSMSYCDSFCGGMAELYNAAKAAGANVIGQVSTEGYSFDSSAAVVDGKFVGLALDEDNEAGKTTDRINAWADAILPLL
ncbi:MAG: flavodoxin FldA [Bacteroidales bacterium]|nr:flavodoxin FldA [Bacteroidales bacterium]